MAKWFLVQEWYKGKVKPVDVERFTDSNVWIAGGRRVRVSRYEKYFPTWGEAHAHLMESAQARLDAARARLQDAQGNFGRIKGMKEPTND